MRPIIAGVMGSGAVAGLAAARNRLLGRRPAWSASQMLASWTGTEIGSGTRVSALGLRLGYGATVAALWMRLAPLPIRTSALALGSVLFAFELASLPRLGGAGPVRQWPRPELPLLFLQTLLFGAVVCATGRSR